MRITILAPSAKHPVGGVTALYEFANALRHRAHTVCLAHVDFIGWPGSRMALDAAIDRVEEVTWFRFEEGIEHRVGVHDESECRGRLRQLSELRAPGLRRSPVSLPAGVSHPARGYGATWVHRALSQGLHCRG